MLREGEVVDEEDSVSLGDRFEGAPEALFKRFGEEAVRGGEVGGDGGIKEDEVPPLNEWGGSDAAAGKFLIGEVAVESLLLEGAPCVVVVVAGDEEDFKACLAEGVDKSAGEFVFAVGGGGGEVTRDDHMGGPLFQEGIEEGACPANGEIPLPVEEEVEVAKPPLREELPRV